ncbi:MAG: hypothetical protein HOV86_35830 [Thermoactinospora sp.]|nr:hypothetical protein [Thermoactinospora sp.]
MNVDQTVSTFIDFYVERGHRRITGSSLIPPPGDPVLFTTSGMHPLTPYLEGRPHPLGSRLVNLQRCLRTTDLEEVGDPTHLTVFEMLGSWSLGDYDHQQSLRWGYELLRDGFGIPRERLHVTVFGGDGQVGQDTPSLETWSELGVPVELTGDDNWWSNGPTGPCGPDSEIFVWTGEGPPQGTPTGDERWVEVWNHVLMSYRRHEDGSLEPLPQRNIDTGMGLERILTILQGKDSVFDIDVFEPWTRGVSGLWELDRDSLRVVVDHLRSSTMIVDDGVTPSSTGRGYVLRRLVRRVLTTLWRDDPTRTLSDLPTELRRDVVLEEELRFVGLLERGRKVRSRFGERLTQEDYDYLHQTHGLPRELVDLLS